MNMTRSKKRFEARKGSLTAESIIRGGEGCEQGGVLGLGGSVGVFVATLTITC